MNTRLEQFIAAENISKAEFADNIGVARASVSHILAGRNKPSYDFITGLMQRYPRLNMEWLLAGKGKMYKESDTSSAVIAAGQPVAPSAVQEESVPAFPDLFTAVEENAATTPRESNIFGPDAVPDANTELPDGEAHSPSALQSIVNQRKIVKIVVFYDDNTYQELT